MTNANEFLEKIQQHLTEILATSPAADICKNILAVIAQQLTAMDLVTRDEFDEIKTVLIETRRRLEALEGKASGVRSDAGA